MKWYWILLIVIIVLSVVITTFLLWKQSDDIAKMKSELEALAPFKGCSSCLIDALLAKYGYLKTKDIFNNHLSVGNIDNMDETDKQFYTDVFRNKCNCPGISL